jgi:hypothetical protein
MLGKIRLGQNAKQRCLADLRQADDASFHGEFSAFSYQLSVVSFQCNQKNKSSCAIRIRAMVS